MVKTPFDEIYGPLNSRDITPEDCGAKGVGPGACGMYAAIGKVDVMASLTAAASMQARGTFGAGVMLYGIYPKRKDYYAFHVMYRTRQLAKDLEPLFTDHKLGLRHIGEMEPLVAPEMYREYKLPELRRYFMMPPTVDEMRRVAHTDNTDIYIRRRVEEFNREYMGKARIFSSGRNMGVFVTAFDLATTIRAYEIEQYADKPVKALMTHMRWPTSIVDSGVWWGIHPISFLNSSIIHNGDLSSAPSNALGIHAAGVERMVKTDSEAILLEVDNLVATRGFGYQETEWVMCRMFPTEVESLDAESRAKYLGLIQDPVLSRFKMSGPSSFVAIIGVNGHHKVIAGRDRDGLRQMWMGISEDQNSVIWASEEKTIYQTGFKTGVDYRAYNCEPGRLLGFELQADGTINHVFGDYKQFTHR